MDMQFKKYRKTVPTRARPLTQADDERFGGVIQTLEGSKAFQVGDYLARDRKGIWPIRRRKIERDYRRLTAADAEG